MRPIWAAENFKFAFMTMSTESCYTTVLPCGMRIVCAPSATDVAYCGIAVDAGTRDEQPEESGMAHFCEHLTFKGTARRRSWHILNRMETVGGDLNAYTGKEETVYYAAFLKKHCGRAADLLIDIVLGSVYPQAEMNKEVEVVVDEIESYNDTPSELIFDEFEGLVFKGHPLGRNILGEADRLRALQDHDVRGFVHRLYRPDRMVFFVLGNVPPQTVVREVEKALHKVPVERLDRLGEVPPRQLPATYCSREVRQHKDTHQAHVMMGTRAYGALHHNHLALYLLNNILGGPGMNSRLNVSLRERNGLVYTVESNYTAYTDTGIWSVYFGCDPHDVERCRRLVLKELKRLTDAPLSPRELEAAKRQIKGQIGISYDNFESVALSMGKSYLHYNKVKDIGRLYAQLDALTPDDLYAVATELFVPDRLSLLVYS